MAERGSFISSQAKYSLSEGAVAALRVAAAGLLIALVYICLNSTQPTFAVWAGFMSDLLERPDLADRVEAQLNALFGGLNWSFFLASILVAGACVAGWIWWTAPQLILKLSAYLSTAGYALFGAGISLLALLRNHPWTSFWSTLLYLIFFIYKSATRDILYDEAWNYNYFISKPAWLSFALFNTYPLYHFSASLTNLLPVTALGSIRMPVLAIGLASLPVMYQLFSARLKPAIAKLCWVLYVCSYVFNVYGCIGKGIIFSICLSALLLHSFWQLTRLSTKSSTWFLYGLSGLLSALAAPTNFFLLATLALVGWFQLPSMFRQKFLWCNIKIWLAALPFYTGPAMVLATLHSRGHSAGNTGNLLPATIAPWTFARELSKLFFLEVWIGCALMAIIAAILITHWRSANAKPEIITCLALMLTAWLAFVLSGDSLPNRSFAYLLPPFLLLFGWSAEILRKKLKPIYWRLFFGASVLTAAISCTSTHLEYFNPPMVQLESKSVSKFLLQKGVSRCYDMSDGFFEHYPAVEFYYREAGRHWQLSTNKTTSSRFKPFRWADDYDAVVTLLSDSSFADNAQYQRALNGTSFAIYLRRSVRLEGKKH